MSHSRARGLGRRRGQPGLGDVEHTRRRCIGGEPISLPPRKPGDTGDWGLTRPPPGRCRKDPGVRAGVTVEICKCPGTGACTVAPALGVNVRARGFTRQGKPPWDIAWRIDAGVTLSSSLQPEPIGVFVLQGLRPLLTLAGVPALLLPPESHLGVRTSSPSSKLLLSMPGSARWRRAFLLPPRSIGRGDLAGCDTGSPCAVWLAPRDAPRCALE